MASERVTPLTDAVVDDEARQAALDRRRRAIADEEPEPDCQCRQTDVDLFDARGCGLHDPDSPWNQRRRAITEVAKFEQYEPAEAADCPF
jgi:hypothetical protein